MSVWWLPAPPFPPDVFKLKFVQTGTQDLHCHGAVLMLRTLVLTLHDDAGWDVRNAHRGIGGVDVLAAGARGAISIDADPSR